jgi:hypothetical protein
MQDTGFYDYWISQQEKGSAMASIGSASWNSGWQQGSRQQVVLAVLHQQERLA